MTPEELEVKLTRLKHLERNFNPNAIMGGNWRAVAATQAEIMSLRSQIPKAELDKLDQAKK